MRNNLKKFLFLFFVLSVSFNFTVKANEINFEAKNFTLNNAIKVAQYAKSNVNFGTDYRDNIAKSKNIFSYLNCNLSKIKMREKKVHSILFTNNNNKSFEIKAKYFVLALGAFENVRMLKFFFEHFNFRWQIILGYLKSMILASYFNFIIFEIFNRMVCAPMSKFHFFGFTT